MGNYVNLGKPHSQHDHFSLLLVLILKRKFNKDLWGKWLKVKVYCMSNQLAKI